MYICLVIAGRSKLGSILSLGHDNTKPDKLYMRGPEGRGDVEVAVSGIAGQLCLAVKIDNDQLQYLLSSCPSPTHIDLTCLSCMLVVKLPYFLI